MGHEFEDNAIPQGPVSVLPDEHPARSVALYHGTSRFYEGNPSRGGKDVLRTGFPSMTADPGMAEMFTSGNRDSRVYSTRVPHEEILDLRKESEELGKRKEWDRLTGLIQEAAKSGKYKAVAINDITMGSDDPEYRLVGTVPPEKWEVKPTEESVDYLGGVGDSIRDFNAGKKVNKGRRNRTANTVVDNMIEDAEMVDLMRELSEEEGRGDEFPETEALAARVHRDIAQVIALRANRPPGMDSNLEIDWRDWPSDRDAAMSSVRDAVGAYKDADANDGTEGRVDCSHASSEYRGAPREATTHQGKGGGRGIIERMGLRGRR